MLNILFVSLLCLILYYNTYILFIVCVSPLENELDEGRDFILQ